MGVSFEAAPANTVNSVLYHDPDGDVVELNTPYSLNAYQNGAIAQLLKSLGFYTQADGASYNVRVYGTFSGGVPSNLLGETTGTIASAGFHVVDLSSTLLLNPNATFYVELALTNGGSYPQAIDYAESGYTSTKMASLGESYYSFDGTSWTDLASWDNTADFSVNAYLVSVPEPGTFALLAEAFLPEPSESSCEGRGALIGRAASSGGGPGAVEFAHDRTRDPRPAWYDHPAYYDLAFRSETTPEADFIEAACRKYCPWPREGCWSRRAAPAGWSWNWPPVDMMSAASTSAGRRWGICDAAWPGEACGRRSFRPTWPTSGFPAVGVAARSTRPTTPSVPGEKLHRARKFWHQIHMASTTAGSTQFPRTFGCQPRRRRLCQGLASKRRRSRP